MTAFFVSTTVYFSGLWLGSHLLRQNDIELPGFSRWVILNTFALLLAYLAAMPF